MPAVVKETADTISSLVLLAKSGDADSYGALVRRFQDIAVGYGYRFSATFSWRRMSYVTKGDLAKIREMLKNDPSLAAVTDKDGVSAVLKAVYYRPNEIAAILVQAREELSIFKAAATGQLQRIRTLLERERSLANSYSPDGFTPLGLAAFFGHIEAVRELLAAGADVGAVSRKRNGSSAYQLSGRGETG